MLKVNTNIKIDVNVIYLLVFVFLFSFREFYYIQMEKYARQAVSEGVKCVDDIHITLDSEIYRVLNLHYNRNNHIEVCCLQVNLILYHLQFILLSIIIVYLSF